MEVSQNNIKSITKDILAQQIELRIKNDVSFIDVTKLIDLVIAYEDEAKETKLKIILEKFFVDDLIVFYKHILSHKSLSNIRNISIVQNILALVKTFNTFDQSFFDNEEIYINSIEDFIDIKTAVAEEIASFDKTIIEYFLSMCKSYSKIDYTELDTYEEMPVFFQIFFSALDLTTVFGIFSMLPDKVDFNLKKVKYSMLYINNMMQSYKFSDFLINDFLQGVK